MRTETTTRLSPAPRMVRTWSVAGAVVAALAANLVLWGIGQLLGGNFTAGNSDDSAVTVGHVVSSTVGPLLIGMALAAVISLRWPAVIRLAQVIGAVLALGTIAGTLAAGFDGASTVVLALMHVTVAAAVVVGLEAIRRALPRE